MRVRQLRRALLRPDTGAGDLPQMPHGATAAEGPRFPSAAWGAAQNSLGMASRVAQAWRRTPSAISVERRAKPIVLGQVSARLGVM